MERKRFLRVPLINIGAKHQPDIWNFLEITNPVAHCGCEFPRFKPVVREIDPRCLFANSAFVSRDIFWRHIVLRRIVLIGSNAAPIQAVIKLACRRDGDANVLRMQSRRASRQQQMNYPHRTTVGQQPRLPNWQPNGPLYPKHLRYEKESHWKKSKERSPAQSAPPRRRLRNPWPHHR